MNRIKTVLKKQGRTQTWLAQQLRRSYVVISNYCNNKTQPDQATLRKIAELLDVELSELNGGGKEPNITGLMIPENGFKKYLDLDI